MIAAEEAAEAEKAEKEGRPPAEPWRPDPHDWTLLHELLVRVNDRLGEMAALLVDMPVGHGVKQRTRPPAAFLRPETMLDKERRRIREAREKAEDDRLLDITSAAQQRYREQKAAAQA